MYNAIIHQQLKNTCRKILNHQDMDPISPTFGCFDRLYWSWKFKDFPDATLQRNIKLLLWHQDTCQDNDVIQRAIVGGLKYFLKIQHKDGSFDQAYPFERSIGATGFLVESLLPVYQEICENFETSKKKEIEEAFYKSCEFLIRFDEGHGNISNHLAGISFALLRAGKIFQEQRFTKRSESILERIVKNQSDEGWYREYNGADPGYQTQCMDYLTRIHQITKNPRLLKSLEKSISFLHYFAHPDGTFGGEYGSRRTGIFYPGGIAYLAQYDSRAMNLLNFMINAISMGNTITLTDIDIGNTAPLASSYIQALENLDLIKKSVNILPCKQNEIYHSFQKAGFSIRGSSRYYAIIGVSNGGIIKIFDKKLKKIVYSNSGFVFKKKNGQKFTNQQTNLSNSFTIEDSTVYFSTRIVSYRSMHQSPLKTILLRLANLTFLKNRVINEFVKKILVKAFIEPGKQSGLCLIGELIFTNNSIVMKYLVKGKKASAIEEIWRTSGFNAIHMASAGYPISLSETGMKTRIEYKKMGDEINWEEKIDFLFQN